MSDGEWYGPARTAPPLWQTLSTPAFEAARDRAQGRGGAAPPKPPDVPEPPRPRPDLRAITADPVLRRRLLVPALQAIQHREGIDTTLEQAGAAYDAVQAERAAAGPEPVHPDLMFWRDRGRILVRHGSGADGTMYRTPTGPRVMWWHRQPPIADTAVVASFEMWVRTEGGNA